VVYIIGSPKNRLSTTAALLGALPQRLRGGEPIFVSTSGLTPENTEHEAAKAAVLIKEADVVIIGFPLYIDAIPSHLLRLLEALGRELSHEITEIGDLVDSEAESRQSVYAVINSGFYEPEHMEIAADMMALWCDGAGLDYLGAVLVGAGACGPKIANGKGPGKPVGRALDALEDAVSEGKSIETIKVTPSTPRKLYMWRGNKDWIKAAKNRGVSKQMLRSSPPST
jgi:NAD(P)H-dependent FMN reductase